MTMPVTAEDSVPLTWHRHIIARLATGSARLLIRLPPSRLGRLLRMISRGTRPATTTQALSARQAVVSVSARCAGQGCLQRSVAVALLCRAVGTWPDWCTGFRTRPFRAHAWVEVDGDAVGEPLDMRLFHTVMSVRCPTREVR